ncbi:PQQ-binding-like beta-propeller repeat protein [Streptomyces sp. NPDC050400]|uniref:PQQ-binding-like beta-propeller repeat protein n=1 Tax=Streptomyces sp. NPDC050400 TaxID=3365610 RepID=UPI00379CB1D2
MTTNGRRAHGISSRRHLLRLAGGGVALSLLGAGAVGCEEDAPEDAAGVEPQPSGGGKETDADAGGAPKPVWTESAAVHPSMGDGHLIATSGLVLIAGKPMVARDGASGKQKWSLPDGTVPTSKLLTADGTLYLASSAYDNSVIGYDPADGKETWRSRASKAFQQPRVIAADGKQVYVIAGILEKDFTSKRNIIAALDARSGRDVWREQRDFGTEETGITAAVHGDRLVYTDFRKNLTVRDTATGKQVWTQKTNETNFKGFAVHDGLVILAQGRKLQAFSLSDGAKKWTLDAGRFGSFKQPGLVDGVLYVADSSRTLWAVQPKTGAKIWQSKDIAEADGKTPWQYVKVGRTLYAATELDEKGGVHAIDAETGKLRWTFNDGSGDYHQWLVATDGKHVFALHGKKLHALPV